MFIFNVNVNHKNSIEYTINRYISSIFIIINYFELYNTIIYNRNYFPSATRGHNLLWMPMENNKSSTTLNGVRYFSFTIFTFTRLSTAFLLSREQGGNVAGIPVTLY